MESSDIKEISQPSPPEVPRLEAPGRPGPVPSSARWPPRQTPILPSPTAPCHHENFVLITPCPQQGAQHLSVPGAVSLHGPSSVANVSGHGAGGGLSAPAAGQSPVHTVTDRGHLLISSLAAICISKLFSLKSTPFSFKDHLKPSIFYPQFL